MTHPEELLAGYVDGTLSPKERVAVDSHVADCARCKREISLAAAGRSALRSLAEEPAPPGIAARALEEAAGARRSADGGTPRWYRVGGAVAAVAAGLLVLTLVLPRIGQNEDAGGDVAAQGASGAAERSALGATDLKASVIEIQNRNYDDASLTDLARSYVSLDSGGGDTSGGEAGTAQAPAAPLYGGPAQTQKALACISRSAPAEIGEIQKIIRARFDGTPAYLAVFLEGPGAGQPADAVAVWVLATKDCRILSFSSAQL